MLKKNKMRLLEQEISELKHENELLKNNIKAISGEYAKREQPQPPKFFISCEKYIQMIDFVKDGLIRNDLTLGSSLELLNTLRDMAVKQE